MKTLSAAIILGLVALLSNGCMPLTQPVEANWGQHPQSFKIEMTKTVSADYLLYIPEKYVTTQNEWPLILFLHGAGERGNNLSKVEIHGPPMLIAKEKRELPFIIVSPQCPEGDFWTSEVQLETLDALLVNIVSRYRIDQDRIYVTGLSMGGYGAWSLAAAHPDRFAAIAPICGGGNPKDAANIAHLPIWVFHGAKDRTVPLAKSEEMVSALQKVGGKVKFTVYPDAGHDSWTATYANPELFAWFLEHTRSGNAQHKMK